MRRLALALAALGACSSPPAAVRVGPAPRPAVQPPAATTTSTSTPEGVRLAERPATVSPTAPSTSTTLPPPSTVAVPVSPALNPPELVDPEDSPSPQGRTTRGLDEAPEVWRDLSDCESGSDPTTDSGNGYYGAYQFSLATWRSVGETGNPAEYSYAHQTAAAQRLQARSGWGQWPACSRRLGLV